MLCGRSASRTSMSLSGRGKDATSPRAATVAVSVAASGLGWHGGSGCSARAAADAVRSASRTFVGRRKCLGLDLNFILISLRGGASIRRDRSEARFVPCGWLHDFRKASARLHGRRDHGQGVVPGHRLCSHLCIGQRQQHIRGNEDPSAKQGSWEPWPFLPRPVSARETRR